MSYQGHLKYKKQSYNFVMTSCPTTVKIKLDIVPKIL